MRRIEKGRRVSPGALRSILAICDVLFLHDVKALLEGFVAEDLLDLLVARELLSAAFPIVAAEPDVGAINPDLRSRLQALADKSPLDFLCLSGGNKLHVRLSSIL